MSKEKIPSVREVVAQLRAEGRLDEKKWRRFKRNVAIIWCFLFLMGAILVLMYGFASSENSPAIGMVIIAVAIGIFSVTAVSKLYRKMVYLFNCGKICHGENIGKIDKSILIKSRYTDRLKYKYVVNEQEYFGSHTIRKEDVCKDINIIYDPSNPNVSAIYTARDANLGELFKDTK